MDQQTLSADYLKAQEDKKIAEQKKKEEEQKKKEEAIKKEKEEKYKKEHPEKKVNAPTTTAEVVRKVLNEDEDKENDQQVKQTLERVHT